MHFDKLFKLFGEMEMSRCDEQMNVLYFFLAF